VGLVDESDGQRWYFSLNNRRLWVFKRCAEEGLLDDSGGKIWVRVREPKSQKEKERYSIENCAVEAKFIRERTPDASAKAPTEKVVVEEVHVGKDGAEIIPTGDRVGGDSGANGENESSQDESINLKPTNRFAVVADDSSSEESDDESGGGNFTNRFAGLDLL